MPDQSSNATLLRAGQFYVDLYLSDMSGASVFSATADSAADAESETDITVTAVSGSAANVKAGMSVVVTDSSGFYKGTHTIRYSGTISSTNLPLREFSKGSAQIASGDTLTVYGDPMLTDKLPISDETFAPDGTPISDNNSNPPPICNSGGHWAGWLEDATAIPFKGDTSFTVDPDSGGSGTHLYATTGGTLSSTTNANPTLGLAAAGKYHVTHTFTDSDNSKSATQIVLVRAHDANDPPYELTVTNVELDPTSGARVTVQLFASAALSNIRDGAFVILWGDHVFAGAKQLFGNVIPSRSHIVCAGYFRRDRSRMEYTNDTIEFEIISPLARLAELPGFSKAMIREASPDSWEEIKGLTIGRGLLQLIQWYTNLNTCHDLVFNGFTDTDYPALYLQKQNPFGQVNELADSRDCILTCDRNGRFEVQKLLQYTKQSDWAGITTTFTFTADDYIRAEWSREHNDPVETVRTRGFTGGTTVESVRPMFARAPASPGRGNSVVTQERLVVDDQTDMFERTAMRYAWENKVYFTTGGRKYHAGEMTLTVPIAYAQMFQNYREFVAFASGACVSPRGEDASTFKWIVLGATSRYDVDGVGECDLRLRAATAAPSDAAVDDTPAETPGTGGVDPPVVVTPEIPVVPGVGAYNGRLALFTSAGYLLLTWNFAAVPVWVGYDLSSGVTGTWLQWVVDAATPTSGHIVTSTRIYDLDDFRLGGGVTATLQKTFGATSSRRSADFSFGYGGAGLFGRVITNYGTSGTSYVETLDGSTWSAETALHAAYDDGTPDFWTPGCIISPYTGDTFTSIMTTTGNSGSQVAQGKKITYGGVVSTTAADPVDGMYGDAHLPFQGNGDDGILYYAKHTLPGGDRRLMKRAAGSNTDVSPIVSATPYCIPPENNSRGAVSTSPTNRNRVAFVGVDGVLSPSKYGLFASVSGASSWSTRVTPATSVKWRRVFLINDYEMFLCGADGYIGYSPDFGATIYDKRGNIPTDYPSIGTIIGIAGW